MLVLRMLAIVAAVVVLVGSGSFASGDEAAPKEMNGLPLVLEEKFEKGSERWVATDPAAWEIVEEKGNHVFALTRQSKYEPPVRSPINMARVKDVVVGDFVLEAKMKQTGKEYGHRDMCVFFGYQDASHFYYAHIATKADEHANSIFIVNGEPRVSIAKERTPGTDWGKDVYHVVRIVRETASGVIKVYFDDMNKPIMTAEDKTFLSGTVGFGSFDDTGQICDVRLWGRESKKAK